MLITNLNGHLVFEPERLLLDSKFNIKIVFFEFNNVMNIF